MIQQSRQLFPSHTSLFPVGRALILSHHILVDGKIQGPLDIKPFDGLSNRPDHQLTFTNHLHLLGKSFRFAYQFVIHPNQPHLIYIWVLFQCYPHPTTTREQFAKHGLLHIRMMVKYHQSKRFFDAVYPEFRNIVIITRVYPMHCIQWQIRHQLLQLSLCLPIAITVSALNLCAVHPLKHLTLHKGISLIYMCEIEYR